MGNHAKCPMPPSLRPFAGALLVGLFCALPAIAQGDVAPRPVRPAAAVREPVLNLESWEYTNNQNSLNNNQNNNQQTITDIVVFVTWTNLNLGSNKVSASIFDLLLLEYVYDVSVLGTISQAQLNALVYGQFFVNQVIINPSATTSTSGTPTVRTLIAEAIRNAIRKFLGL
jgi:hypothetical protein